MKSLTQYQVYKIDETNQLLTLKIPLHVTDLGNKVLLLLLVFIIICSYCFSPLTRRTMLNDIANFTHHLKRYSQLSVFQCEVVSHTLIHI